MSPEDEESQPKAATEVVPQPKTSADPFSTFLRGVTPSQAAAATSAIAAAAALAGPVAIPVAGAAAGLLLAVAIQRALREKTESPTRKRIAREIDGVSVAVLLYIADGKEHSVSEVAEALALPRDDVRIAIDALRGNELLETSHGEPGENIRISPGGRAAIIHVSSEIAS